MGRFINLTGQVFGKLTVIERDNSVSKDKGAYWICRCQCGNIVSVKSYSLRSGATKSCGCLNKEINSKPKEITNMVGRRFGKLTVIKRYGTHITKGGQKKPTWLCICDCGNEKIATSQDLKTGHVKSCGCITTKPKGSGLIDLTGKRFGKLVVVERTEEDYTYETNGHATTSPMWRCICDCGNIVVCQGGNLRSGNTTSCGCDKIKSKGEEKIAEFLNQNNIKYLREYSFDDLRNKSGNLLRFDFAILDEKLNVIMLVEYQGEQHYIDRTSFGEYQRNYSDKRKKDYCKLNDITLYEIRFDEDLTKACNDLLNKINMLQKMKFKIKS